MNLTALCVVVFVCSRQRTPVCSDLMAVYRDRVPRWRSDSWQTFSVDSCGNSSYGDGIVPLNFPGPNGTCVWGCVNTRERAALLFASRNVPSRCTAVAKVTGKYFAPSFEKVLKNVTDDAQVVLQQDRYRSELFLMTPARFREYPTFRLARRMNNEFRLDMLARSLPPSQVQRLPRLEILGRTRRSDGRVLRWL